MKIVRKGMRPSSKRIVVAVLNSDSIRISDVPWTVLSVSRVCLVSQVG